MHTRRYPFDRERRLVAKPRGNRHLGRIALATLCQVTLLPAQTDQFLADDVLSFGCLPAKLFGVVLTGFGQRFDEILPVKAIQENVHTTISPTHHMIDGTSIFEAQFAWHGASPPFSAICSNCKMNRVMG